MALRNIRKLWKIDVINFKQTRISYQPQQSPEASNAMLSPICVIHRKGFKCLYFYRYHEIGKMCMTAKVWLLRAWQTCLIVWHRRNQWDTISCKSCEKKESDLFLFEKKKRKKSCWVQEVLFVRKSPPPGWQVGLAGCVLHSMWRYGENLLEICFEEGYGKKRICSPDTSWNWNQKVLNPELGMHLIKILLRNVADMELCCLDLPSGKYVLPTRKDHWLADSPCDSLWGHWLFASAFKLRGWFSVWDWTKIHDWARWNSANKLPIELAKSLSGLNCNGTTTPAQFCFLLIRVTSQ